MEANKDQFFAESLDPEYEDYSRNFAALEVETEKLLKDTKAFSEAVVSTSANMRTCARSLPG